MPQPKLKEEASKAQLQEHHEKAADHHAQIAAGHSAQANEHAVESSKSYAKTHNSR